MSQIYINAIRTKWKINFFPLKEKEKIEKYKRMYLLTKNQSKCYMEISAIRLFCSGSRIFLWQIK